MGEEREIGKERKRVREKRIRGREGEDWEGREEREGREREEAGRDGAEKEGRR